MYYRRKFYNVKGEFIEVFNTHFNETNLPTQLKYGSRLIGRWMKDNNDGNVEVFAIWEYDSYEDYKEIESKVRNDKAPLKRVKDWYEKKRRKGACLQRILFRSEKRSYRIDCSRS